MTRKSKLVALSVAFAMGVSGAVLGPAFAVPDYPTWAEVEAAKDDVEEKEKLIEELEGYLAELGAELDELNTIALIKNEEYNQAVEEVNILTRRVGQLEQELEEAAAEAESVRLQLGQMAARMYREGTSGNSSLELFSIQTQQMICCINWAPKRSLHPGPRPFTSEAWKSRQTQSH